MKRTKIIVRAYEVVVLIGCTSAIGFWGAGFEYAAKLSLVVMVMSALVLAAF